MKKFEIYISHKFGPDKSYVIKARNLAKAKKKAKDLYAYEYFKKSYLKVEKALVFSTSSRFIDLGLPSGRLWATENEPGYHQFDEAVKTFGDMLPSAEAWRELFDHCSYEWDNDRKGYVLTGPNGNSIFLPADGWQHWDKKTEEQNGDLGFYWSLSPRGKAYAWNVRFSSGFLTPQDYSNHQYGFSVRLCKSK